MNTYQTLPILLPNKYGTARGIIVTNGGSSHIPTISHATGLGTLRALPAPQQPEVKAQPPTHWSDMNDRNGCSIHIPQSTIPASKSVVRGQPWSWCSTVWAVIATVFCASFCGFIGLLCAVHAYVDHKTGDAMGSRYKTKCSWCWSWIGILLGLVGIVAVVVLTVKYGYDVDEDWNLVWEED